MTIEPFERCRFHVYSGENVYLVDLAEHAGNGACSCLHFVTRLKPEIESGRKGAFRCKHIIKAREALLDRLIKEIIKQYPD